MKKFILISVMMVFTASLCFAWGGNGYWKKEIIPVKTSRITNDGYLNCGIRKNGAHVCKMTTAPIKTIIYHEYTYR